MYNKKIVLDFDGTICRLFANYDLYETKLKLHNMFKKYNIIFDLSDDIFDAFALGMCQPETIKDNLLFEINAIITKAEIEAIESGIIVDGFFDFIDFVTTYDLSISIVTNNSKDCIVKFLSKYFNNLEILIRGRLWQRPDLMKPNPYLLEEICKDLKCNHNDIIFIGDNPRDYESAFQFGCDFIGLAPTEKKKNRMSEIQDIVIFNDFHELLLHLIFF